MTTGSLTSWGMGEGFWHKCFFFLTTSKKVVVTRDSLTRVFLRDASSVTKKREKREKISSIFGIRSRSGMERNLVIGLLVLHKFYIAQSCLLLLISILPIEINN